MTCIVGLVEDGKVYMGADSAGVAGFSIKARADEKVFQNGPFLMGFTSSFRMGQLLHYSFSPPTARVSEDIDRWMVTEFIGGVRACLKEGGFAKKDNEVESGGCFLVGYRGRLHYIGSDYQVGRVHDDYLATGCGEDMALGAMYATKGLGMNPEKRVLRALEAAAHHNNGVCAPFVVKVLT